MGTENLHIRPARDGDRATLERLIAECYGTVYPGWYDEDVLGDAMPAMLRIDPALLASGRYFVATLGDAIAGCGGWSTNSPGSSEVIDKTGHIRHFATLPDLMGKGIGGAIIERCIAEAAQTGHATATLLLKPSGRRLLRPPRLCETRQCQCHAAGWRVFSGGADGKEFAILIARCSTIISHGLHYSRNHILRSVAVLTSCCGQRDFLTRPQNKAGQIGIAIASRAVTDLTS